MRERFASILDAYDMWLGDLAVRGTAGRAVRDLSLRRGSPPGCSLARSCVAVRRARARLGGDPRPSNRSMSGSLPRRCLPFSAALDDSLDEPPSGPSSNGSGNFRMRFERAGDCVLRRDEITLLLDERGRAGGRGRWTGTADRTCAVLPESRQHSLRVVEAPQLDQSLDLVGAADCATVLWGVTRARAPRAPLLPSWGGEQCPFRRSDDDFSISGGPHDLERARSRLRRPARRLCAPPTTAAPASAVASAWPTPQ